MCKNNGQSTSKIKARNANSECARCSTGGRTCSIDDGMVSVDRNMGMAWRGARDAVCACSVRYDGWMVCEVLTVHICCGWDGCGSGWIAYLGCPRWVTWVQKIFIFIFYHYVGYVWLVLLGRRKVVMGLLWGLFVSTEYGR